MKLGVSNKTKIGTLIISILIFGFCGVLWNQYQKHSNIEHILKTKSYSYLPQKAKDYIKEVYESTGNIVFTEKNKENNKPYLNPDYVDYIANEDNKDAEVIPIPMVVDYSSVQFSGNTLESSYDLRNVNDNNYVTPVRNQGNLGLCWAFSTAGVVESYLLKNSNTSYSDGSTLISERQIDYATAYNGINEYSSEYHSFILRELGAGGNFYISTIAIASGISLVDYNSFKEYDDTDILPMELHEVLNYDNSLYEVNKTINMPILNLRKYTSTLTPEEENTRESYINEVKENIKKYGAAYVSTRMGSGNNCTHLDPSNNQLIIDVYNCSTSDGAHAMQIIGWDDNQEYTYCADNKTHDADTTDCNDIVTGKGVWILKNSWGTKNQYPYLTYDSLKSEVSFVTDLNNTEERNWDNNYIIGNETSVVTTSQTLKNTKIEGSEYLKKIKFIAETSETTYELRVETSTATYTFSQYNESPGLITFDIDKDILIDKDTMIQVTSNGSFIEKLLIFTKNTTNAPFIDLVQYNNMDTSDYVYRLYSNTKNIPSNIELTYKL